jgi:microcompartment protein CcmL/EutN
MNQSLGILETYGLTPTLAAVDAMEKAARVQVVQCELNDFLGVVTKIAGPTAAVESGGGRPRPPAPRPGPAAASAISRTVE